MQITKNEKGIIIAAQMDQASYSAEVSGRIVERLDAGILRFGGESVKQVKGKGWSEWDAKIGFVPISPAGAEIMESFYTALKTAQPLPCVAEKDWAKCGF